MSEFLPVKSIYTGAEVTALGEAQPDDVMLSPDGGIKFPDGSILITANGSGGTQGPAGASAYEIAVANGFVGTEAEWLASLEGAPGADGAPGIPGNDGAAGAEGLSAYEVAVTNGFAGTEQEWLDSLRGADGADGAPGADSTVPGPAGADGAAGLSAYEVAVTNGYVGTEAEWLVSLKGADGADSTVPGPAGPAGADSTIPGPAGADGAAGAPGLSAYEVAVSNGYAGTEADWLASLKGADGAPGPAGADSTVPGPAGADSTVPGPVGPAGPSAVSADAGNSAVLGSDNLIFVPASSTSALEARVAALEAAMAQLLPWTKL